MYDYVALARYDDKLDEQRYPFVAISQNSFSSSPPTVIANPLGLLITNVIHALVHIFFV